jgi:enterobactin synthetase component D
MPNRPPIVTEEPFIPGSAMASVALGAIAAHGDEVAVGPASDIHADELAFAASLAPARREAFLAGRWALRAALRQIAPHNVSSPLLQTGRGAPHLPQGWTGSISHKRTRAIALAAPSIGGRLGVDLEERPADTDPERPSIASRILTAAEREALEGLNPLAHREATLVRFAIKEAVYKAIDPFVQRYVRFTEVELDVADDGGTTVRLLLPEAAARAIHVQARWRFHRDGAKRASGRATLSAGATPPPLRAVPPRHRDSGSRVPHGTRAARAGPYIAASS